MRSKLTAFQEQSMPRILIAIFLAAALPLSSSAGEPERKVNLAVLYLGNPDTPRGRAYADFLGKHFRKVEIAERKGFDPKRAEPFDVVVLDWSQNERPEKPMSPLGPKNTWGKPTVLLGSAGLLLAEAWEIVGTIG
jgi:hypothetical protein